VQNVSGRPFGQAFTPRLVIICSCYSGLAGQEYGLDCARRAAARDNEAAQQAARGAARQIVRQADEAARRMSKVEIAGPRNGLLPAFETIEREREVHYRLKMFKADWASA